MRVEKAIRALIRSWKSNAGKGNNFKLFWEGQMQFPGTVCDCSISSFLTEVLMLSLHRSVIWVV